MKALTLTEPWATLMMLDEKRIETRSWKFPQWLLGQEVGIHSAKGFPGWAKETVTEEPFLSVLYKHRAVPDSNRGNVLCVVRLIDCRPTEDVAKQITEQEKEFGDYGYGRYAWMTEYVRRLEQPMPAVGHLGFWEWNP